MQLRPGLHQFDRRRLTVSNMLFQPPDQGRLFIFESAMSASEAAPTRGML
jgi:hypothetical protein